MALLTGGNIANVERVKIVTKETTARTFVFQTASSVTFTPSISAGAEKEQRVKNTIMGLLRTEDLVKGYDIDMEDQRIIIEVFSLIDGGTITMEETPSTEWEKYSSPVAGSAVTRIAFDISFYTSDRDSDGDAIEYYEWKFVNCKGTPVSGGAKDDDFQTLKYTLKSRPAAGESAMEIARVDTLPTVS